MFLHTKNKRPSGEVMGENRTTATFSGDASASLLVRQGADPKLGDASAVGDKDK